MGCSLVKAMQISALSQGIMFHEYNLYYFDLKTWVQPMCRLETWSHWVFITLNGMDGEDGEWSCIKVTGAAEFGYISQLCQF